MMKLVALLLVPAVSGQVVVTMTDGHIDFATGTGFGEVGVVGGAAFYGLQFTISGLTMTSELAVTKAYGMGGDPGAADASIPLCSAMHGWTGSANSNTAVLYSLTNTPIDLTCLPDPVTGDCLPPNTPCPMAQIEGGGITFGQEGGEDVCYESIYASDLDGSMIPAMGMCLSEIMAGATSECTTCDTTACETSACTGKAVWIKETGDEGEVGDYFVRFASNEDIGGWQMEFTGVVATDGGDITMEVLQPGNWMSSGAPPGTWLVVSLSGDVIPAMEGVFRSLGAMTNASMDPAVGDICTSGILSSPAGTALDTGFYCLSQCPECGTTECETSSCTGKAVWIAECTDFDYVVRFVSNEDIGGWQLTFSGLAEGWTITDPLVEGDWMASLSGNMWLGVSLTGDVIPAEENVYRSLGAITGTMAADATDICIPEGILSDPSGNALDAGFYCLSQCPECGTTECASCDTTECASCDTTECASCDTTECASCDTTECASCDTTESSGSGGGHAKGDPHFVNVKGEAFDVMQTGNMLLLEVPMGSAQDLALRADIERLEVVECGPTFITSVYMTGKWLGSTVDIRSGPIIEKKQKARKRTFGIRLNKGEWESHADFMTKHTTTKLSKEASISVKEREFHLKVNVLNMKITQPKRARVFLDVTVTGIGQLKTEVGGLLGLADHKKEEALPAECKVKLAMSRSPQEDMSWSATASL